MNKRIILFPFFWIFLIIPFVLSAGPSKSVLSSATKVIGTASILGAGVITAAAWNIYKNDCKTRDIHPTRKEFWPFFKKLLNDAVSSDSEVRSIINEEHPYFTKLVRTTGAGSGLTALLLASDLFNKQIDSSDPVSQKV